MSEVVRSTVAATAELRRRVLRPGGALELPGDDDEGIAWFAVVEHGAVVSTGNVRSGPAPAPVPACVGAWRLRGMATLPERRGAGLGASVLRSAVAHVVSCGGSLLWCNARTPAQQFYERQGFLPVGERWLDPVIGPHVRMWRDLHRPT